MRLKIFTLLAVGAALGLSAQKVGDTFYYPNEGDQKIMYKVISDTECETAPAEGIYIVEEEWGAALYDPALGDPYLAKGPNDVNNTVKIPEKVSDEAGNEFTVVRIGEYSFAGSNISKIELPETVTRIDEGGLCFTQLTEFTWSKTMTIGEDAFYKSKLQTLSINPTESTIIPKNAFRGCGELKTVTIGGYVTEIGESAFEGCTSLSSLTLNEGLEKIGDNAFKVYAGEIKKTETPYSPNSPEGGGKSVIGTLTIPASVNYLGKSAFEGCSELTTLEFKGDNITEIGDRAFFNCSRLGEITETSKTETINIPPSVKRIGNEAFAFIGKAKNINFGMDLEEIGECAFFKAGLLECITLPDGVKEIGKYAFYYVSKTELHSQSTDDCVHLGNSLERVGEYAFYEVKTSNLHLPATLKYVGDHAFDFQSLHTTNSVGEPDKLCDIYLEAWPDFDQAKNRIQSPYLETEGFGYIKDNEYAIRYWIYPLVCLHVPKGTEDIYRADVNGWGQFKCIIGDIVDRNVELEALIDYMFIVPGDEIDLEAYVHSESEGFEFEPYFANEKEFETWKQGKTDMQINQAKIEALLDEKKSERPWEWIVYNVENCEDNEGANIVIESSKEKVKVKDEDGIEHEVEVVNINKVIPTSGNDFSFNIGGKAGRGDDAKADDVYKGRILTLDAAGKGVANDFGEVIALGFRDMGNYRNDGQIRFAQKTLAAAVAIFVCPTLTVIYNDEGHVKPHPDATDPSVQSQKPRKVTNDDGIAAVDVDPNSLQSTYTENYTTYENRVVYNSVPKVQLTTATNLEVSKIERAESDKDGNMTILSGDGVSTDNPYLQDITEEKDATKGNNIGDGYIVPIDPITSNRVLQVYTVMNTTLSDVCDVEVSSTITVHVEGNVLTVVGAEDDDVVTIVNINGQVVYRGTDKTVTLGQQGVYVATVADAAFKIVAR